MRGWGLAGEATYRGGSGMEVREAENRVEGRAGKGWGRRRLNGVCERVGVIGINTVFTQIGAEPQRGRKVREQRSEKRVRGE